jgi:CubicO group peptidase (beta-lactamase class C family)
MSGSARLIALISLAAVTTVTGMSARQSARPAGVAVVTPAQVDAIFSHLTRETPGCAVGVSVAGAPLLSRAYGMADLEHDVPNTPDTIFEAGSVSKQFTAAAVLLLARDGKLSLDDEARKYIPELPAYGPRLTIRHMLNHTSGLRDWGSVAGIGGWPRTSRVYTHAHVLEIVRRQRALNFPPGAYYSYSNTGYNLAAILVSRVSGMSFADFTRTRIFEPMGMSRTSWRDDHGRIVKQRALSYEVASDGTTRTVMPFENVHGNGGLLTTVGDLLKWNEHFVAPRIADAAFVAEQERPGRFTDGRAHGYALGLRVGRLDGVREVAHSGSTAGYRAHLSRYPDQRVSVAVLCNGSSAAATRYSDDIARLYLAPSLKPSSLTSTYTLTPADVERLVGQYRHVERGTTFTIEKSDDGVRIGRGPTLAASAATRLQDPEGRLEWQADGTVVDTDEFGTVNRFVRATPPRYTAADLEAFPGAYVSDEAEVTVTVSIENGRLVLKRRPDTTIALTPVYADGFSSSIGTVIFRRDGGRVTGLSVVQERVWDLRFERRQGPAGTSARR